VPVQALVLVLVLVLVQALVPVPVQALVLAQGLALALVQALVQVQVQVPVAECLLAPRRISPCWGPGRCRRTHWCSFPYRSPSSGPSACLPRS
jgi:hypothetical protein